MSNANIDLAALSAAQACHSAYSAQGTQGDYRGACTLGVTDGIHRAQDMVTTGQTKTVDQWNALCMADAKTSNLPQNQQLPYQMGCQFFATGFLQ